MNPKIQVIILNYKTFELTISYIQSLLQQKDVELSVLVVDNKSENKSYEIIKENFKKYSNIEVIESMYNGGYAYGNNFGLKYLRKKQYDYLLISNNDIELSNNYLLAKITNQYKNLINPAFVSPIQIVNGNPYVPAWKQPTIWYDILTNVPIVNKIIVRNNLYKLIKNKTYFPVDVLPGSFFFSKKEIIYKIGLMDEKTFLYGEERILAYKVKKNSLQNYLLTAIEYEHKPSSTISSYLDKCKRLKMAHSSIIHYHENYVKSPVYLIVLLKFIYNNICKTKN